MKRIEVNLIFGPTFFLKVILKAVAERMKTERTLDHGSEAPTTGDQCLPRRADLGKYLRQSVSTKESYTHNPLKMGRGPE